MMMLTQSSLTRSQYEEEGLGNCRHSSSSWEIRLCWHFVLNSTTEQWKDLHLHGGFTQQQVDYGA